MFDPMLNLYAKMYRFNNSEVVEPLSEEATNVVGDYISGCNNQMSLAELEELASEEEEDV
jgi:hypothetical protein